MKKFILILALTLLVSPVLATGELGAQWISTGGSGSSFDALWSLDDSIVGFYPTDGKIYRSADGGKTWTVINSSVGWPTGASADYCGFAYFNGSLWLFGGGSNIGQNQTWYSSDKGYTWVQANASSAWMARGDISATVYNNRIWFTGGHNYSKWSSPPDGNTGFYNDTWWLDTANASKGIWTRSCNNCIPERFFHRHRMITLAGKMWLIGGNNSLGQANAEYYSTDGITWTAVDAGAAPYRRDHNIAVTSNGTAYLIGGSSYATGTVSDTWKSQDGLSWDLVNSSSPSTEMMINWTPPNATIWGGTEGLYKASNHYSLPPPSGDLTPKTASGEAPFQVQWTDLSTGFKDAYSWDFMDGDSESGVYSETDSADTGHIFSAAGTYNITLTVLSPFGYDMVYSNITVSAGIPSYATSQNVRFVIKTMWGDPIEHVTISVVGVNTTAGNWDWLKSLLGMPLDTAPIHNSTLTCYTDMFGSCTFMMFPAVRYDLSITNTSLSISEKYSVYPKDEYYEIWVTTSESWFTHGYEPIEEINITVTKARKNATHGFINVTYKDALAGTTGDKIYVNQTNKTGVDLNEITVKSSNIVASDFTASFEVPADDDSYFVTFQIAHSTFGNIVRTFSVIFEKAQVGIGLPSSWLIYLAVFFILFTGMFFGATTSPTIGAILTCFVGWIMWGIGWMEDMGLAAPTVLVFATFISFLSVIMHRSRKERYL